ncbi:MAG: BlaI/MecI/CopY family transcriptional regulator [Mycobacteriales bacterium]
MGTSEGRAGMAQLGELERAVMERVWAWQRPVSVRDVVDDLVRERDLAYTTVMTIMERLHHKGFLSRERVGKAYVYEAMSTREAYTAALMNVALATSNDRHGALVHFIDEMDPDEVEELRLALAKVRRRGRVR